jgi:hypothetical protein
MMGKLYEPKREEGKKSWRKLNNEKIHDLNTPHLLLGDKMNKDEKKGACATYKGEHTCIRDFVWETSREEPTWLTEV